MKQLDRLLKNVKISQTSELDNIIGFYKAILELERIKEPDITTHYPYQLHFKSDDNEVILIDLECDMNFTEKFLDNRKQSFPKDLYIGLPVVRKDDSTEQQINIFSLSIDYNDLNGYNPQEQLLPIKISNFTLDSRNIIDFELSDEHIEELKSELGQIKNISALKDLVKRYLGENTVLKEELQLALSSKNIALAQITAELKNLNFSLVEKNDLLKRFLTHSDFYNQVVDISVDDIIRVSPLDESQASAVAHALSNRLSVITGAPGTGKTQVILNIIANALIENKSVLVASKNNKAVDNVKERFDKIDSSQYLLRFGKKEYVGTQTIPAINSIHGRLNIVVNQPDNLADLLKEQEDLASKIKDSKKKLLKIDELKVLIPKQISDIKIIEEEISLENQRYSEFVIEIKSKYSEESLLEGESLKDISAITSEIIKLRNSLQIRYGGVLRIWHNTFSRKKHAAKLLGLIEDLPFAVKTELRLRGISRSVIDFKDGNATIEYSALVIKLLEGVIDNIQTLSKETKKHEDRINSLTLSLNLANETYNDFANEFEFLSGKKREFQYLISKSINELIALGPQIVEAKIKAIEKAPNAAERISNYKAYLPNSIPWKGTEVSEFTKTCREFIEVCRLVSVTNLSIKSGFPLSDNLFDILIIDEASQCDVASAIPLILRAKQVVIIGDPMQLRHITSVKVDEENAIRKYFGLQSKSHLKYAAQSLWDYAADFLAYASSNNTPITLENHYRCHHDIIGYSNYQFYGKRLNKQLIIKTDESKMILPQKGMVMINVCGLQESELLNVNKAEAERVISIAKELNTLNAGISIGIVTPFRDQADYIKSLLANPMRDESLKKSVEVNTAHGFQGDEKDVIIYSLVVTENTPQRKVNWIDYMAPNLVNVAVTRARQTLFIVGNADYIKQVSPEENVLGSLIRYAQSKR